MTPLNKPFLIQNIVFNIGVKDRIIGVILGAIQFSAKCEIAQTVDIKYISKIIKVIIALHY